MLRNFLCLSLKAVTSRKMFILLMAHQSLKGIFHQGRRKWHRYLCLYLLALSKWILTERHSSQTSLFKKSERNIIIAICTTKIARGMGSPLCVSFTITEVGRPFAQNHLNEVLYNDHLMQDNSESSSLQLSVSSIWKWNVPLGMATNCFKY